MKHLGYDFQHDRFLSFGVIEDFKFSQISNFMRDFFTKQCQLSLTEIIFTRPTVGENLIEIRFVVLEI